MASSILWRDGDHTVTLIDIPRSIEVAQGPGVQQHRRLLSSPPLQSPFPTNGPASSSAKAKLSSSEKDAELHDGYRQVLQKALATVREERLGHWCFPRTSTPASTRFTKKRKLNNGDPASPISKYSGETAAPDSVGELPPELLRELSQGGFQGECAISDASSCKTERRKRWFSNFQHESTALQLVNHSTGDESVYRFHVPSGSRFYLGDCSDAKAFRDAVREAASRYQKGRHKFDFILMDPPWPNRSVKRTHNTPGSTYSTTPSMWEMRELLFDTKIELLMADNCLLGIWITNKPAVRDLVLGDEGLFACWAIELVEEWVWLKTTLHGEPVSPLEALWRKPYEVLLLGRKRPPNRQNAFTEDVKKRVIIAVPDLHSRKPCLKELIEPLMLDPKEYSALEVFARHLVTGWWSWGNENIKFNWTGYWHEEDGNDS